ncbi:MAG TPA: IS21-like element helper ATPase IstB [Gammaproteobacteria bacterium]|nr:IS21-like element helper ATPase IstB [Gammaproteobacteria bacterium]
MLTHPTLDKLQQLRLSGMHAALLEQQRLPDIGELGFEERLGLLVDRELTAREDRRLRTRLRQAQLRDSRACPEDIDWHSPRGLGKALITQLATGQWIHDGLNLILEGAAGTGKTFLACALAHSACRCGYTARYLRWPRLAEDLALAHGDGRYPMLMRAFARTQLIIIDDFGLATLTAPQRRDLLELLDDRHGHHATLVCAQMPVEHWHELIGDPTIADAVLDRLVHSAYRITLKGESMRKRRSPRLTPATQSE